MALVETESIEIDKYNRIEVVFLNNPKTKNSMSPEMGQQFREKIRQIESSKNPPRCIILAGKNEIFSAGGNFDLLKSFANNDFETNRKFMYEFYNYFLCIRNVSIPVIGAINGHAVGAGLSLAMACDLRVFAFEGKYTFNFVKLGIHPGMGSSFIVQDLFGKDMANRLLFLCETHSGESAFQNRLCYDVVPKEEVLRRATEIAIDLSESAPLAVSALKKNTYDWDALQKALEKEAEAQAKNFISEDFKETIRSLEEKRPPEFKGF